MPPTTSWQRPAELLQQLIRIDTTNPPGNETACATHVKDILASAGIEVQLLAKTPERANLVARLPGRGEAPPFLMYGHMDVVTTEKQPWQHPPFGGDIVDGYMWGRGTLDMKGGIAMMLSAFLHAKAEGFTPPGDVILALIADEEDGGEYGARYLVEEHPELLQDVRYAIGEFGGFSLTISGQRFYPIMVAEKQMCWMQATVRGRGGHGSMPERGGAMAKLAHVLHQLDSRRLPVHITPVARMMVGEMTDGLRGAPRLMLKQLLNPALTDVVLDVLGTQARTFDPLFHNTVSPTILHGSDKVNVIPSEVAVELDGRLLPGQQPEDIIAELHSIAGNDVEFEVRKFEPGPPEPDMTLFDTLAGILREADPDGIPIPYLLSGVTDGRHFAKLGIQTYGFLPMQLPPGFNFAQTVHGTDERVPVDAINFGTEAIYTLLQRVGG